MSTPLGPGVTARNGPTLRETSGMSERGDTPVAAGLTYFRREATARPTRARQNSAASNPASELEPAVKALNPSKPQIAKVISRLTISMRFGGCAMCATPGFKVAPRRHWLPMGRQTGGMRVSRGDATPACSGRLNLVNGRGTWL